MERATQNHIYVLCLFFSLLKLLPYLSAAFHIYCIPDVTLKAFGLKMWYVSISNWSFAFVSRNK